MQLTTTAAQRIAGSDLKRAAMKHVLGVIRLGADPSFWKFR